MIINIIICSYYNAVTKICKYKLDFYYKFYLYLNIIFKYIEITIFFLLFLKKEIIIYPILIFDINFYNTELILYTLKLKNIYMEKK